MSDQDTSTNHALSTNDTFQFEAHGPVLNQAPTFELIPPADLSGFLKMVGEAIESSILAPNKPEGWNLFELHPTFDYLGNNLTGHNIIEQSWTSAWRTWSRKVADPTAITQVWLYSEGFYLKIAGRICKQEEFFRYDLDMIPSSD